MGVFINKWMIRTGSHKNIHRVLLSFQHAATTSNNVAAFRKAGIILDPKSVDNRVVLRAYVDRSQAISAIQYLASHECAEADRISAGSIQVPLDSTNQQTSEVHDPLVGGEIGRDASLVLSDMEIEGVSCDNVDGQPQVPTIPPPKKRKRKEGGQGVASNKARKALKKRVNPKVTQQKST